MRNFIFFTEEGFTETPRNEDIENFQVLGMANGVDEEDASNNFIQKYDFLKNAGYRNAFAMELVDKKWYYFGF